MTRDQHITAARLAKARALADTLQNAACNSETARHLPDGGWMQAALAAGKNPPSEATKQIVITILEEREGRRDSDNGYCGEHR